MQKRHAVLLTIAAFVPPITSWSGRTLVERYERHP
jgi:hypothetical protein